MAKSNLEKLSLDELKALQKDVEKAIADYQSRKRKEAIEAVKAAAKEHGFSLSELSGGTATKKGKMSKSPPKYRHPQNPEMTWTGRGRQPAWIKEALEDGRSLDEFAV